MSFNQPKAVSPMGIYFVINFVRSSLSALDHLQYISFESLLPSLIIFYFCFIWGLVPISDFYSLPKQQLCKVGVSHSKNNKLLFNNSQCLLFYILLTKTFGFVFFQFIYTGVICLNLCWFQSIFVSVMSSTCHQELFTMGCSFEMSFNTFFCMRYSYI